MTNRDSQSIQVIRSFIVEHNMQLDASAVVSLECFQTWMRLRRSTTPDADGRKFHRALTSLVSAADGKCSFQPEEEAAILVVLRRRQSWPCFVNIPSLSHLGKQYRSKGYHEKQLQLPLQQQQIQLATLANINEIVFQLGAEDAKYLTQLSGHVMQNPCFQSPSVVFDLLKFVILGKTIRCCKNAPLSRAQELLLGCAAPADAQVMVLDMTAQSYSQCVLVQNNVCFKDHNLLWHGELLRVILAIGGAYHRPGVKFTIRQQAIHNASSCFDVTYWVDVDSFFLVVILTG